MIILVTVIIVIMTILHNSCQSTHQGQFWTRLLDFFCYRRSEIGSRKRIQTTEIRSHSLYVQERRHKEKKGTNGKAGLRTLLIDKGV